jgi:hypothetical protein
MLHYYPLLLHLNHNCHILGESGTIFTVILVKYTLMTDMPVVVSIDCSAIEPSLAPLQEFERDGCHVTSECALVRPAETTHV